MKDSAWSEMIGSKLYKIDQNNALMSTIYR